MSWDLIYLTGMVLASGIFSTVHTSVVPREFTQEELTMFASMRLCSHFGGSAASCNQTCPYRYIRHRFGVPLCAPRVDFECCIGPPTDGEETAASTLTTTTHTPTTSASVPAPADNSRGTCGLMSRRSLRRKRIVGGRLSSPGRWPWLAALRSQLTGAHTCSGALIPGGWVVTAAHCFKFVSNPRLWRVRLGEYDLLSEESGERNLNIHRIVLHPNYSSMASNSSSLQHKYLHDIALVQLTAVPSNQPICLPADPTDLADVRPGDAGLGTCWVAGWGATRDASVTDQHLREVTGPVHTSDVCARMWGVQLQNDALCFGDGTYGPCAGDSGGPLLCLSGGRFHLSGVVSWGTESCNVTGYPSVFTNLRPYLAWISRTVNPQ